MDTGRIHLRRLASVNDVGKAINPQQVTGQIEGTVSASARLDAHGGFQAKGRPGADKPPHTT